MQIYFGVTLKTLELLLRELNRVQTRGALSHHTFSVWAEASQPSTKFAYHIKYPAFVKEAVAMDPKGLFMKSLTQFKHVPNVML